MKMTLLSAKPSCWSVALACSSLIPASRSSSSPMISAKLRISPAESKTAMLFALNASAFFMAFVERSRRTIFIAVPASWALTPWSANAANTATPSSMSLPTIFSAAPAFVVSDWENCSTLAFAKVLAFTRTSDTRAMFSMFLTVSSRIVSPRADCASVRRSVAWARSKAPA